MIPQFNRAESARVIPVFHSTHYSAIGAGNWVAESIIIQHNYNKNYLMAIYPG